MVKVITGEKGMGKSKKMVEMANNHAKEVQGNIVFIDDDNRIMYELDSSIRFVNLTEYAVDSHASFYGFVCGMISSNYDIEEFYVDGLASMSNLEPDKLDELIREISKLSEERNIDFYLCFNAEEDRLSDYIKGMIYQI